MNQQTLVSLAVGVCIGMAVILTIHSHRAHANPAAQAECLRIAGATPAKIAKAYQDQMNTWLAEGKTQFVTNTVVICAY